MVVIIFSKDANDKVDEDSDVRTFADVEEMLKCVHAEAKLLECVCIGFRIFTPQNTVICPMNCVIAVPMIFGMFDWNQCVAKPIFVNEIDRFLRAVLRDDPKDCQIQNVGMTALPNLDLVAEEYEPPKGEAVRSRVIDTRHPLGSCIEGHGRPYSAAASDRYPTAPRSLFRPSKVEGHGRPLSAAASDRLVGARMMRPGKIEGHGRPMSAAASDHMGGGKLRRPWETEGHGRPSSRRRVGRDEVEQGDHFDAMKRSDCAFSSDEEKDCSEDEDFRSAAPAVIISSNRTVIDVAPLQRIDDYFDDDDDDDDVVDDDDHEEECEDSKSAEKSLPTPPPLPLPCSESTVKTAGNGVFAKDDASDPLLPIYLSTPQLGDARPIMDAGMMTDAIVDASLDAPILGASGPSDANDSDAVRGDADVM